MGEREVRNVLAIPAFRRLWIALTLSSLGDWLGLVPTLVPPSQLESANRLSLVTTYGSAAVASTLFAVLAEVSQALGHGFQHFRSNPIDLALYIDAMTFLVSAATVFTLRMISSPRGADGTAPEERPSTW